MIQTVTDKQTIRCAIYTRKSHEKGLDQELSSLHAQREAAEAFIASQRHEGWQACRPTTATATIPVPTLTGPAFRSS